MIRTRNFDPNTMSGFRYMCKVVEPNVKYPTSNSMLGIFSDRVLRRKNCPIILKLILFKRVQMANTRTQKLNCHSIVVHFDQLLMI